MTEQRVVLVTGASSGIGQATARLLAREGFRVFGTSRKPSADGVEMVALDVTSDESAKACVESVLKRGGRLDALVNMLGHAKLRVEITINKMPLRKAA